MNAVEEAIAQNSSLTDKEKEKIQGLLIELGRKQEALDLAISAYNDIDAQLFILNEDLQRQTELWSDAWASANAAQAKLDVANLFMDNLEKLILACMS